MTKAELEARVKELEGQVSKLEQDIKDVGMTADVYEMSALRHAALLYDLGKSFDKTNFSQLLDKQLAMSTSIKPVKNNRILEIIGDEIVKKSGKVSDKIELFKGEKRGVFGCLYPSNSVYGGYICEIYRVSSRTRLLSWHTVRAVWRQKKQLFSVWIC